MIPKIIHQVWIGPNPPPRKWMDSFRNFCEEYGWEYRLWGEGAVAELGLINRKAYDHYYDLERYFGAADIVRSEVMAKYGGWYFDADCELLEPELFANHEMHNESFVVASTIQAGPYMGRLPNTVYACEAGHPAATAYIETITTMQDENNLEPAWDTVGGTALTMAIDATGRDNIKIMPMCTFYPEHGGRPVPITAPVLSIHHWASSRKIWQRGRYED